ncbi:predicted protein [Nematostella vectensis]|uniref:Tropomodulin n=1 Tax=Nematostella vectensis TaxID=45351 RepID=A7S397_NEMVE|nr:predicted protein [Nematostella vectensis]|eukprot:XP_001633911.1 predicted protein [Nematostella vectensis]
MAWVKQKEKVNLGEFEDINEDEIVEGLTEEELKQLNLAIDPENQYLPAYMRQEDQTDKVQTTPFDREKLLKHLEEQAKNDKEREEAVPFKKETRGKVFVKKERPKRDDPVPMLPDDLSDVLENATEEQLLELAGVLGIHSMLTSEQSHQAEREASDRFLKGSGLKKYTPDLTAINELDLEKAMKKLKNGDSSLTRLNLNNHKDVTPEILEEVAAEMKKSTTLKHLEMANTQMTDRIGRLFADALKKNKTLRSLNMESNFLSGEVLLEVVKVIADNTTLKELRLDNQVSIIGAKMEQLIVKAMEENKTLQKFSLSFDTQYPRIRAAEIMVRNNDSSMWLFLSQ